ncbi:phosphatase PAP2 family protein [Fructilactobacillus sp. Tb1]|uniref:phosphatase PAP2 family protein n=1 Tax=Fructilactobacillus sp. Tb1 TaxID=3422304 RepID=UPI003D27518A
MVKNKFLGNGFYLSIIAFVLLMSIASVSDLKISNLVINYNSWFAILFQVIGELPLYLIFVIAGEFAMGYALRIKKHDQCFSLALFVAGFSLSLWQLKLCINEIYVYIDSASNNLNHGLPVGLASTINDTSAHSSGIATLLICLVIWGVITLVMQSLIEKMSEQKVKKLLLISVFASATAWFALEANLALKDTWGRYRPYEIGKSAEHFTNWFQINGKTGHKSFPSGHTMAATLAIVGSWFVADKYRKATFYCGLGWAILVGFSRLIIGAHFMSDITFSFFLTLLIIFTMNRILKIYLK